MNAAEPALLDVSPGLLLYVGPLLDLDPHRHPAIAICFALESPIPLPRHGRVRSLAVAADAAAPALPFGGQRTAIVFVQPDHPAFGAWRSWLAAADWLAPIPLESDWLAALHTISDQAPLAAVSDLLAQSVPPAPEPANPRIGHVMQLIIDEIDAPRLRDALAEAVELSGSRLQHLFKAQTGTTLRRFRLWARLCRAVDWIAQGGGLTDAAHMAGFSDSAHLTHVAREFFGLAPRHVVKVESGLRVVSRLRHDGD